MARAKAWKKNGCDYQVQTFINTGAAGKEQIGSSYSLGPLGPLYMSTRAGGSSETEKFGYQINVVSLKHTG